MSKENDTADLIIVANGAFPASDRCRAMLSCAGTIVCCDGAADKLTAAGFEPDLIIGDMDSLSVAKRTKWANKMIRIEDQNSNDLSKAVHYCASIGHKNAVILGATGLREDHTLGNISLMLTYLPLMKVSIESDYGSFFPVYSNKAVTCSPGEQISIFSMDNRIKVSASGLKYPLDELRLSHWYTASLNETTGESFSLQFESDTPLLVYRALIP